MRPSVLCVYLFALACLSFAFSSPAHALGEIRLVAGSDTPGMNYTDISVIAGDTIVLELWVEADTRINGFAAYMTYGGQGVRLREAADATDSFTNAAAGVQANEDHTSFGDILRNQGSWTGASTDTFQYVALTGLDSVQGAFRAASVCFTAETAGTYTINYVFNSSVNQTSAIVEANGLGTDRLTTSDSGVVSVTIIDTRLPNVWYLNDASRTGDSFTFAVGADTANGLTRLTPKRTFSSIERFLTAGDTVYVDAGTYLEGDSVTIDTNSIWIIGKDSASTIVTFTDSSAGTGGSVYAQGRTYFEVRDLAVLRARHGVYLVNADTARIVGVRADTCSSRGVYVSSGSDSVVIVSCRTVDNTWHGIDVDGSVFGTVRGCYSANSPNRGISIGLSSADATVSGNTALGNLVGIEVNASDRTSVSGNTISGNTGAGLQMSQSSFVISTGNLITGNSGAGIDWSNWGSGAIIGDTIVSNNGYGIDLGPNSDGNTVRGCLIANNSLNGIMVNTSANNAFHQNTLDSNGGYQIRIFNSASVADTFHKNVIRPAAATPDSGLDAGYAGARFDFTRNWWGTVDTTAVKRMIQGAGRDSIIYTPFRLGSVDTAAGADTVAPRAPDTVAGYGLTDTALRVTWSVTTTSEEAEGALGLAGYRIYRSPIADTSVWIQIGQSVTTGFTDSGLNTNETRYYRVTAFDGAGVENQSFYSDSIVAIATLHETQPPADFTLLLPVTGTETQALTLTFRWSNSSDSSPTLSYRLIIDTDMAGSFIVDTTVFDTDAVLTLAANDTYRWRVIASDTYGAARTVGDSVFVLDTASPNVGAPSTPAAGHETSASTITFMWTAGSDTHAGVRDYRLQIDTSGLFTVILVDSLTPLTSGIRTLAPNDTYYWRIITADDAGNTSASSSRFVAIDTSTPSPVSAVYPVALSETNAASVGFVWTASADTGVGLAAYHLQIDTTGAFAGAMAVDSDVAASSPDTAIAVGEGVWYWRVLARDDAGNTTAYTAPIRFVVDRTAPIIVAVTLGSNVPTFFTDSSGIDTAAAEDTVFFNNGSFGAGQNVTATVTATGADSVTFPQAFADGPFYDSVAPYAFIYSIENGLGDTVTVLYARDTAGNFDSMVIRWIRDTLPPPLALQLNPSDSQVTGDTTPTFSWVSSVDSGAGTKSYVVQIANSMSFGMLIESTVVSGLSYTSSGLPDSIYFWRVIPQDSVSNADTAVAVVRMFRIDSGFPAVIAIEVTSSAPNYFYDDTPVVPGATPDTVYYNPTGGGAGQVDTIRVYIQDINESAVVGTSAFTPIQLSDSGLNRDSYILVYQIPSNAGPATITIVASDATGFQDTVLVRFEADTYGPTAAVPASPLDGHETAALTVLFTWTASTDTGAGVSGYALQIDTSAGFGSPFVDSAVGNVTSASRTLPTNDTYYWRLVAADRVSNSTTGPSRRLVVDTAPPVPAAALSLPADLAETKVQTVSFVWTAAADTGTGVNGYRLQLDTSASFLTPLRDSFTTAITGALTGIPANDTYFWRVISIDDAGNTTASSPRTFLVDTILPVAAMLSTPTDATETSVNAILFSWTTAFDSFTGLREHRLQIDTANTFVALMVDSSTGLATSGMRTLVGTETYYWRVLAVDDARNETATTSRRLVVDTTPPVAGALGLPLTGLDTNATSILFSWAAGADTGTGVAVYHLQADTSSGFAVPRLDSTTPATTGMLTLAANDTWYWRIVVFDDAGNTVAVAPNMLRVDTLPPVAGSLTNPAANFDTSSTTITFAWTAGADSLSGVAGYRLQIDTVGTFPAPFVDAATGLALSGQQTLAANDTYYWRVVVTDSATNTDTYVFRRIRVDTTPPSTPLLVNKFGDSFTTLVPLTWNPSLDSHTAIASYVIQVDTAGTFASLKESATNAWNDTDYTSALTAPDTYWWRVIAYDSAGNAAVSASDTFRIVILDTMPPGAFAFTTPSDLYETRSVSFRLQWTDALDDTSPPVRYRVQIDTAGTFASPYLDTTGLIDTFLVATFAANETSSWRVIASDNAGNTTVITGGSRRVVVDTAGPIGLALSVPADPTDTRATTITFSWTVASDTGTGLSRYRIQADTVGLFLAPFLDSATAAVTSASLSLLPNDTYFWRVVAEDDVGNTTTVAARTLRVDTGSPAAAGLTAPANNTDTSTTTITFTWAASLDSITAIASYRLQIDTSGVFTAPLADSSTGILTTGSWILAANDTYYWRVVTADNAGNTVASSTNLLRVDTRPPTAAALTSPVSGFDTRFGVIAFAWSASTDTGTGVASYRLEIDTAGTFVSLLDSSTGVAIVATRSLALNDTYYWRVVTADNAGNTVASSGRLFRVDSLPPSPPILIARNGETVVAAPTLAWIASFDTISGLAYYNIQIDTAGTFASIRESIALSAGDSDHIPTTLSSADTYYWRVIAFDTAGNARVSPSVDSFRLLVTDTTSPVAFTFTAPLDLYETRATTFMLRWTDALDSSTPVRYRVQVDTTGTFAASYVDTAGLIDTFLFATFAVNETSSWRVIASDNAGNTTTITGGSRRVVVDTAGPIGLALSSPADPTDTRSTTISFSWTAAADTGSGLLRYRLQVDTVGTFLAPFVDSSTAAVTGASRALPPNDTYYWRIVAEDDAGNTTTVTARTLRVDTQAPSGGTLSAPGTGTDTTATTITFFWTPSSDTGSGVAGYRLQIDTSGSFTSLIEDSSTPALTGSRTLAANDTYFWRIVSVDNAGNTSAFSSTYLRIDTLGPSAVALSAPVDLHDTTATTITFSWSAATDTGTGVTGYRLQVDTGGAFAAPLVNVATGLVTNSAQTLAANDTYYWRVIANDNAGNATASASRRVRVDTAPPTTPILAKIAGDSRISPVTLTWSAVTDSITQPRSFVIQIDTAGTFAALVDSVNQTVSDTDYVTGMLTFETHYWRVLAYDTLGNVSTSAIDSFAVRVGDTVPPAAFNLTLPANDSLSAGVTITFRWQNALDDSSPPVRYRLQIDTSGSFASALTDTSWFTDTFVTVTLAANDTYYWRVIARDNSLNTTASTSTFRFAIDTAPPSVPALFAYRGDTTRTPPVYLRWAASTDSIAGVARYLLQLDSTISFTAPLNDSIYLASPDTDHFTAVLAADTYYWRVYAFDSVGNSAVSAIDSFVIRIPDTIAPIILSATATPSSVSNAGTTVVTFTVLAKDSGYVASVVIHLAGVGGTDSQAFIPATAVPSSDSRWTLTHVFDTTVTGGVYTLTVTAIDASNNASSTTTTVTVSDLSPTFAPLLDTPLANIRAGGNELSIISVYGETYSKVLYQFRAVPAGAWMTCTPSRMSVMNPDTLGPFWGFYWDISSLSDSTQYDVRSVGTLRPVSPDTVGVTDSNPGFIRITIAARDSNVNEYRSTTTNLHIRRQLVRSDTFSQIAIAERTTLDVPLGAVTDSVWIRVTVYETTPTATPVSSIFVIPGNGTFREFIREDGRRAFSNNSKLTLTLPYGDTDPLNDNVLTTGVREADLAIYHFDDVLRTWVKEQTSQVDPLRNVVTATIDHFTIFAVLAGAPATANLQEVVVYPNPFIPYDNVDKNGKPYSAADPTSGILFDSLPTQVTIDVYDIAGRRVATMSKTSAFAHYQWDAHSDDGRELASGVYIAVIRSTTGEQIIRKIMVVR